MPRRERPDVRRRAARDAADGDARARETVNEFGGSEEDLPMLRKVIETVRNGGYAQEGLLEKG